MRDLEKGHKWGYMNINKKNVLYMVVLSIILSGLLFSCNRGNKSENKTGSLTWELKDGILIINGKGPMPNYERYGGPWCNLDDGFSDIMAIIINDGVTNIGDNAFVNIETVMYVSIPGSVTNIGENAFKGCSGITSIIIPDGVINIDRSAFQGCSKLIYVDIPDSIKSIGRGAFYNCTNLVSITIPAGVTTIRDDTFNDCSSLAGITIPASVTSIGDRAFENCASLTSVTIPEGVTFIGQIAFQNCTSLTGITIPASVMSMNYSAFRNCFRLTGITVDANNPNYASEGGILYNKTKTTLIAYPSATGSVTIPAGVTSISNSAFYNCTWLTSITIPASVTDIGNGAFADCNRLASITVATNNPKYASEGGILYDKTKTTLITYASTIGSLTIPAGITTIGMQASNGLTNPTSITIPARVTSIDDWAFIFCKRLTSITVDTGNPNYASQDGVLYNKAKTKIVHIPQAISGSVTIPEGVTHIYGFSRCTGLTSITIPEGVTSIGSSAFRGCTGLTSITLPESVTEIGNFAFSGCTGLTSITIPASVTTVGFGAFIDWTNTQTINVPFANADAIPDGWKKTIAGLEGLQNCEAVIKYWNGTTWE